MAGKMNRLELSRREGERVRLRVLGSDVVIWVDVVEIQDGRVSLAFLAHRESIEILREELLREGE